MRNTIVGLATASAVMLILAYFSGGMPLVTDGLMQAGQTTTRAFLLIFSAFLLIGQLQKLISSEMIKVWLKKYSGGKGVIFSSLAGGLFPGGPYIFYPFLSGFKKKGIPFYLLLAFISGKQTYDFARLPLEIGLITPWLALLRNIITLPVPIIVGLFSKRFLPGGFAGSDWEERDGL